MKLNLKILFTLIIIIIIVTSVYIFYFSEEEQIDNKPPEIISVTENISGILGDKIKIFVTYTDNIEVTSSLLFYKTVSESEWTTKPIINGSVELALNSKKNLNFYVTVDDAAGNGPVGKPSKDGSTYYTITVKEKSNESEYIRHVLVEEGSLNSCKFCPIISQWLTSHALTLGIFIFMMGKNQILATTMNIKLLT